MSQLYQNLVSIMPEILHDVQHWISHVFPAASETTIHALAGGLGSVLSMSVLYPLDTVRVRLQVDDGNRARSALAVLREIINEEGWDGVYRGASPMMKTLFCSYFVYFFTYNGLRTLAVDHRPTPTKDLTYSLIAAIVNVMVTAPLFLVNTRMKFQGSKFTQNSNQPPTSRHYTGLFDGMRCVIREEGVGALWRGTVPSLILTINPALQMMFYESMKRVAQILFQRKDLGAVLYFIMGAVSKLLATVTTYPVQIVQSRVRSGHREHEAKLSVFQAVEQIFRCEGVAGLYRGLQAKLLQTMLNAALMFMCYEEIVRFLMDILKKP